MQEDMQEDTFKAIIYRPSTDQVPTKLRPSTAGVPQEFRRSSKSGNSLRRGNEQNRDTGRVGLKA